MFPSYCSNVLLLYRTLLLYCSTTVPSDNPTKVRSLLVYILGIGFQDYSAYLYSLLHLPINTTSTSSTSSTSFTTNSFSACLSALSIDTYTVNSIPESRHYLVQPSVAYIYPNISITSPLHNIYLPFSNFNKTTLLHSTHPL